MNERLLQFIWQFQYFNKHQVKTDEGEPLQILHAGTHNLNQGPDFLNATIKIGDTTWVGNIELHVKASDWNRHNHSDDPNYRNVILHVVWENDHSIGRSATLSLQERVPKILTEKYRQLMEGSLEQACKSFLPALSRLQWLAWKERLVAERLERRSEKVLQMLDESKQHWEEVFWWMLAANFGIKVNSDAFEAMARSIPVTILGRHKNQLHQVEALLLGQSNLLHERFKEDYPIMLQREYNFLKKKYNLKPVGVPVHFLRMRPANFPAVRLAQLAMLVHRSTHLFSTTREMQSVKDVRQLLNVTANDYWHYHYTFDELTACSPKHLGRQMADNILINTIVPVLFAYGMFTKQEAYKEKAVHWLQQLSAEQNAVTRRWAASEVDNRSAFDSQSLLELTSHFCNQQRCLDCAIGNKVLRGDEMVKTS